jgi:hypothetical protein
MGREASATELDVLRRAHDDHAAEFAADPDRARRALVVGELTAPEGADASQLAELATYTMLANLVLNLDEFLSKN